MYKKKEYAKILKKIKIKNNTLKSFSIAKDRIDSRSLKQYSHTFKLPILFYHKYIPLFVSYIHTYIKRLKCTGL